MNNTTILKSSTHFYFIVIGIFLLLISGSLMTEGYTESGLENSVFVKQFANGGDYNNYWNANEAARLADPANTKYYLPLSFYIEGKLMQIMGDSYMFEKIYSVFIFILCALLLLRLWTLIGNPVNTGWLPLLFWLSAPIVGVSATGNLRAGPYAMIILLIICSFQHGFNEQHKAEVYSREHPGDRKKYVYFIKGCFFDVSSAVLMMLAFYIRGSQSLYFLLAPLVYWLYYHHRKVGRPLIGVGVILAVWALIAFLSYLHQGVSYQVVERYIHECIPANFSQRTVASHFYIIWELVKQMSVAVFVMAGVSFVLWKRNKFTKYLIYWKHRDELGKSDLANSRCTYLCLSMGIICLIPLALSLYQSERDLVAIIPLFSLGCGCFVNNIISEYLDNVKPIANRVLATIGIGVMMAALIVNVSHIKNYYADGEIISDMHSILPLLKDGEVVSAPEEVVNDKTVTAYYYRYKNITFDTALTHPHLIARQTNVSDKTNAYGLIRLGTTHYYLFQNRTE